MGKKSKQGKQRLDTYYHQAKAQGYRARSAFKLIQINKKYGFLSKSRCTIDLCAAPGGWLQVAAKEMPASSLIIGVDLDPIKPIPNCITLMEDITSQKCRNELKRIMKNFKADVVLNDGAPNVGGAWSKDAFSQSELCLWACKLATEFLRKGGTFVTKVFRSQDYNALIWAFNQMFEKVEATKPSASRSESAEIFVVCQGFLAPKKLDPRLLDIRHVFEQPDVIKRPDILKQKKDVRHRTGYEEGVTLLYKEASVSSFMASDDPIRILSEYNSLKFSTPECQQYKEHPLTTTDILESCDDIRVLGKRELRDLLRWRIRVSDSFKKKAEEDRILAKRAAGEAEEEKVEEDSDSDVDAELDELQRNALRKLKRAKKKAAEIKRKLKERVDLKMTIPGDVLDTGDSHVNLFNLSSIPSKRALNKVTEISLESQQAAEEAYVSSGDEGDEDESDVESAIDSDEERQRYLNELETNMDIVFQDYAERRGMAVKRIKKGKKEKKPAKDFELELSAATETIDMPDYDAPNLSSDVTSAVERRKRKRHVEADDDEDMDIVDLPIPDKARPNTNPLLVNLDFGDTADSRAQAMAHWFDQDEFEDLETGSDDENTNVVLKKKKSEQKKQKQEARETKHKQDLQKKESKILNIAPVATRPIGGVPGGAPTRPSTAAPTQNDDSDYEDEGSDGDSESSVSSYDDDKDDIAEVAAMAKDILTKKRRLSDYIDESYHRFAFNDTELAPDWFQDDEYKNNKRQMPVTKAQVEEMKAKLKAVNARPIKKVAQAKARKKMKEVQAAVKLRKKATIIAENEDIKAKAKMRSLEALYAKANKSVKRQGHVFVVAKKQFGGKVSSSSKSGGRTKLVDRRMKKELRAKERKEKAGKGKRKRSGKGGGAGKKART